ncbi:MAG TPA: hypothetical protein VNI61_11860 [Gemmatimonadales bacterium]|nr:hypothetical protein [Gemmatimonadales bacterium]
MIALLVAPGIAAAQDQAVPRLGQGQEAALARLREVLPADVAERVIAIVTEATNHGLPGLSVAERALEGVAKGRSGEEVRAAAEAFARDLAASRAAIQQAGRTPDPSEIEAGATAMGLGVDRKAISALASSAPFGRSLAVPLAVIGALVNRGLPSDAALDAVLARLNDRASNTELVEMPGEAGRLIAEGMRPSEVGLALASQRAGRTVPAGPPANVPRNNGRPGERPQPPVQPPVPPAGPPLD